MSEAKEIFKPLFSTRRKIAKEAQEYLRKNNCDPHDATNIVTALSTLGYLKRKED